MRRKEPTAWKMEEKKFSRKQQVDLYLEAVVKELTSVFAYTYYPGHDKLMNVFERFAVKMSLEGWEAKDIKREFYGCLSEGARKADNYNEEYINDFDKVVEDVKTMPESIDKYSILPGVRKKQYTQRKKSAERVMEINKLDSASEIRATYKNHLQECYNGKEHPDEDFLGTLRLKLYRAQHTASGRITSGWGEQVYICTSFSNQKRRMLNEVEDELSRLGEITKRRQEEKEREERERKRKEAELRKQKEKEELEELINPKKGKEDEIPGPKPGYKPPADEGNCDFYDNGSWHKF